jgi:ABC-type uncharacterized transport system permease subunit
MTMMLFHLILAVLTSAVLIMAGFQAVLLAVQERWLRFRPDARFVQKLPPLMVMEKLLFRTILVGFVLLTVMLASSLYVFHAELWHNVLLLPKTILALSAWVIFAVLLLGRYFLGWRGRKAIYGTLAGVLLLLIVYLGSQLLLMGMP